MNQMLIQVFFLQQTNWFFFLSLILPDAWGSAKCPRYFSLSTKFINNYFFSQGKEMAWGNLTLTIDQSKYKYHSNSIAKVSHEFEQRNGTTHWANMWKNIFTLLWLIRSDFFLAFYHVDTPQKKVGRKCPSAIMFVKTPFITQKCNTWL